MRCILRIFSVLLFSSIASGCSPELDVSRQLESDGMPLRALDKNEAIFIYVSGDGHEPGTIENNYSHSSVFLEIGPGDTIYSRRISISWRDDGMPDIEFTTLDQLKLDPDRYEEIRSRLAIYRPPIHLTGGESFTPKGCGIVIGAISPAAISFGRSYKEASSRFIFPAYCDSPSGTIIKDDLNEILASIPPLEGLDGFLID